MSHRYGPHRDLDVPSTVTVRKPFPNGHNEVEVPLPEALVRQRAQINARAHRAGVES